jgi:hypothetical protein
MTTETDKTGTDLDGPADFEAVRPHAFDGVSLDPDVVRRVERRAHCITEEIQRLHGVIDDETFQELLRDDDDA